MADNNLNANINIRTEGMSEFKRVEDAAKSTGRAFDQLSKSEQNAAKEAKGMSGVSGTLLRNLAILGGVSFSVYGLKMLVTDAAQGAYQLSRLGAQAITVRDSFSYMLASVGITSSMLGSLQAAAGGTINSMKLMELSNMALVGLSPQIGNALASQEARLIEISRAALKANPAIGSVEFAYNSLVLGVKRLEKRLVDNIGLQVKVNDANKEYADSIGKTVDQLTAEDKQMAMLNAILKGGSRLIQQVGGDVNTMNDSFMRATTAVQEFKIALGTQLAPGGTGIAETIAADLNALTAKLTGDKLAGVNAQIVLQQQYIAQLNSEITMWTEKFGGTVGAKKMVSDLNIQLEIERQRLADLRAEQEALLAIQSSMGMTQQEKEVRRLVNAQEVAADSTNILRGNLLDLAGASPVVIAAFRRMSAAARALSTDFAGTALLGYTDVMGIKEYSAQVQNLATYEKGLEVQVGLGMITRQEADYQLQRYTDSLTDHYGALQKAANATEKMSDAERELRGIIGEKLEPSFTVEGLAPGLVGRENEVDEHYRRLAAIALNGTKEIEKHSGDWINAFQAMPDKLKEADAGKWLIQNGLGNYFNQIPDAIKKQGSEAMKAWALDQSWADTLAEIPEDVKAKGIEAIKQWAKDKVVAYGKGLDFSLIDRNLLKQQIRDQMAANALREQVINEIYDEMGGAGAGVKLSDIKVAAGDVTGTGSAVGQAITTGMKDSIDVEAMLKTTAAAITTGATTYAEQLKKSGGAVGGVILGGITDAVVNGAPDITLKLAKALAPEVEKIIADKSRRTGESGR